MNTFEMDAAYVAPTYARFPVEIVSGKGSVLTASDGKEYIDMGSGIAVNTFGTADEVWVEAVKAQVEKLNHTSNLFYTNPCAKLAKMLCERTGMQQVFFSNSGAEANECAIKAARKYAEDKSHRSATIITLVNSFHGRTLTTLAATGQDTFHQLFQPLTPGFVHVPANDLAAAKAMAEETNACAIMIEVVQGEGGVLALDRDYVQGLRAMCDELDMLLLCDEVQTGNGRTGKLYGYMNFDVQPDVVSTAKGLGGGLPLGATMLGEKVKDLLGPGTHGSTFGGNPICCAGAVSILSRLDDALMEEVQKKHDYIVSELSGAKGVKSISGMGLMLGIETELGNGVLLPALREKGVLVLSAKAKMRLLPPLNIPMELLEQAVQAIKAACAGE